MVDITSGSSTGAASIIAEMGLPRRLTATSWCSATNAAWIWGSASGNSSPKRPIASTATETLSAYRSDV